MEEAALALYHSINAPYGTVNVLAYDGYLLVWKKPGVVVDVPPRFMGYDVVVEDRPTVNAH